MGDWLQDRCNEIQKAQQEHIQKSFGTDIEKARAGVYKPTKQNLKEGIAGQKYGSDKKEEYSKVDSDLSNLSKEEKQAFEDLKLNKWDKFDKLNSDSKKKVGSVAKKFNESESNKQKFDDKDKIWGYKS